MPKTSNIPLSDLLSILAHCGLLDSRHLENENIRDVTVNVGSTSEDLIIKIPFSYLACSEWTQLTELVIVDDSSEAVKERKAIYNRKRYLERTGRHSD